MGVDLKQSFTWYLEHQDELVNQYNGKILVLVECRVAGAYDTKEEALQSAISAFGLGNFIIQRCSPGETDTTQHFNSRVSFAA
ncbi:MAG TPA: hypothetical protein VMT19_02755 [Thermoanaerobaculaceae bacterium]|nr:hypothetical protein [Thermoanaerobaculaceae bacterium]